MKRLALAALALTAAFAAVPVAMAHTAVRETSIADRANLATAPANFTVSFTAATGIAVVKLTNAAGIAVPLTYTPPREMATSFTIPLPALAPGGYTLSWRAIANDGHAMPGQVRFHVGSMTH